jgi:uncharacterized protein
MNTASPMPLNSKTAPHRSRLNRGLRIAVAALLPVTVTGCHEVSKVLRQSTWHEKCGWKAEDYFDEIDRLVAAGADVNAQGKGKMTPLLWAFPDNKLERFKRLLEHGANPNVVIESSFNTRGGMSSGDSVTHLASKTAFPGYFETVFENGGDVNLVNSGKGNLDDTPLFFVIKWAANKKEKIQFLVNKGADINHMNGTWATPVIQATSWGGQYDIALMLLESGADHKIYVPQSNSRLIHLVLGEERRRSSVWTPQQRADYQKLVKWLVDHGESIEEAKADLERWNSWSRTTGEYQRKIAAEVAARKAKEAKGEAVAPNAEGGAK